MAARLNPRHQLMVREKIKASQLVNVLQDHVLKGKELSKSQVTAALGLLKKCVPDLQSIEGGLDLNASGQINVNVSFKEPSGHQR